MKAERPLNVVFFKTEAGSEPVREWLKSLTRRDCKTIGAEILTVQYAWPIGKPLVDHLGGGFGKFDRGCLKESPEHCSLK